MKIIQTGVTFILLRPLKRILMQLRDDGQGETIRYPNTWVFPGGRKELQEDYLETVIREAKEEFEIDLKPKNCKLLAKHFNEDGVEDDYVFVCRVSNKQIPKLHEGQAMRWMTLSQIKQLDLGFEQKAIIPYIEKHLKLL